MVDEHGAPLHFTAQFLDLARAREALEATVASDVEKPESLVVKKHKNRKPKAASKRAAREALVASERAAREALDASEQRLAASDAAREALVASERAAREALDASEQLDSSLNREHEAAVYDESEDDYDREHEAAVYDESEDDYDREHEAAVYDEHEDDYDREHEAAVYDESAPATASPESATADYLAEHPDRDELTGLLSQRGFQMVFDAHLARCASSHAAGALLLLELDGAEMVNGMLGQETGDALIVSCGQGLRGRLRESDTIARLEGAEFAVLLPDQTSSQAEVVAKALVEVVSEATADIGSSLPARVTIAIGAADFPDQPCSSEEMFARAARAKQVAKDSGRNKYALCRANASGVQRITVKTPAAPAAA